LGLELFFLVPTILHTSLFLERHFWLSPDVWLMGVKIVLSDYQIRRALASAYMMCPFPEYYPVFQGYRDNVSGGPDI
jgi:hypothetical protein